MTRPLRTEISQGATSWDATLNEMLEILFDRALPPPQYASTAALNSARTPADYSGCFALVGDVLYYCDGSSWAIFAPTPALHASTHQHGGSDEIATATAGANAIPKAGGSGKLDSGWLPAATDSVVGALETATQAELDARSATDKIVTPGVLSGVGMHRGVVGSGYLTTDESTTSATFATIPNLTVAVTKAVAGSKLKITASASMVNSAGEGQVQILCDGVVVPPKAFGLLCNSANPCSGSQVAIVTGKAAGSFNVTAQWRTSAGTLSCSASSNDDEGLSIVVEEID